MKHELSNKVKSVALAHGADLVGIVKVSDLPEHAENITRILPSARCVIVVASQHNVAALRSDNNQVAQFDTIYTYGECEQSVHKTTRYLVSEGFPSVAVPAFIPIDMAEPKKGMQGEICCNDLFHTLANRPAREIEELCTSHTLRELWQTFMTGNYYYCFKCQSQCPATKAPRHH